MLNKKTIFKFCSLLILGLAVVNGLSSQNSVSAQSASFAAQSKDSYNSMPTILPYGGTPNGSQYLVMGGPSIDNIARGSRVGGDDIYKELNLVVYSDTKSNTKLQFYFVDRAVNISDHPQQDCNTTVYYYVRGEATPGQINPPGKCSSGVSRDLPIQGIAFNQEITEANPDGGAPIGRGIYRTEVKLLVKSDKQTSFRIATDGKSKIGYRANGWNNIYGSAKDSPLHTFTFAWRAPCSSGYKNDKFIFDEGDEGQPTRQPADARINYTSNGAPAGSNEYFTVQNTGDDVAYSYSSSGTASRSEATISNVNGGNGFGIFLPQDSLTEFFKTCPPKAPTGSGSGNFYLSCDNTAKFTQTYRSRYQLFAYAKGDRTNRLFDFTVNQGESVNFGNRLQQYTKFDTRQDIELFAHVWDPSPPGPATPTNPKPGDSGPLRYDRDTKGNKIPDSELTATISLTCDDSPYLDIGDVGCSGLSVNPHDPQPDNTGRMQVIVTTYVIDGNKTEGVIKKYIVNVPQDNVTRVDFDKSDIPHNQKFYIRTQVTNVDQNGLWSAPDVNGPMYNYAVGSCYSATCTVKFLSNFVGGSDNQVLSDSDATLAITVTNTGAPYHEPLYDEVGGGQLVFKQHNGDTDFPQIDYLGAGGTNPANVTEIGQGDSVTRYYTMKAPSGIGTHTLEGYVAYNGIDSNPFNIGKTPDNSEDVDYCKADYSTFQHFEIDPLVNTIVADSPQNPETISYQVEAHRIGGIYQAGSPNYLGDISSDATSRMYYRKPPEKGKTNLNFITNTNTKQIFSNPPNNNYKFTYTWTDTAAPKFSRHFKGLNVEGDWSPANDDRFCPVYRIESASGFKGPDGIVGSNYKEIDGCDDTSNLDTYPRDRPFVRTYGNDVFAGGSFDDSFGTTVADPFVKSYFQGGSFPGGSGAEFAVTAVGIIDGFSSGSLNYFLAPVGLSFTNDTPLGSFTSNNDWKITDWYNTTHLPTPVSAGTDPVSLTSAGTDGAQQWVKGPINIDGTTIAVPAEYTGRRTIYVDGDVNISHDIVFSNTRTSLDKIPSLIIIAKGNINIADTVGRLDGLFIAQPSSASATNGIINTCTTGSGSPWSDAGLKANCSITKLRVNGAFISQKINLQRTKNTIDSVQKYEGSTERYVQEVYSNDDDNNPSRQIDHAAESIRMTPDIYLAKPVLKPISSQSNGKYDSIKSLPPIL